MLFHVAAIHLVNSQDKECGGSMVVWTDTASLRLWTDDPEFIEDDRACQRKVAIIISSKQTISGYNVTYFRSAEGRHTMSD